MSDNPSIDPGTTPSIPVEGDDIGAGVIRQRVAIAYGAKDATTPVSSGSPLPTADAAVLAELVLVLAKLNASIGVTGTFWQATQPVSGTFWQATQPVSGTVTTTPPSNASTNLAQVAGATVAQGHGTAATALRVELPTDGTGVVGLAAGAATIGSLAANQSVNNAQINGVAPLMGAGTSGTGAQRVVAAGAATGTNTSVAASASTVSLLASNAARRGATFYNEPGGAILYLKLGATASTTSYNIQIAAGGYYEVPAWYNGAIDGIWASASGNVRIGEIT